jgi:hypothetical protein
LTFSERKSHDRIFENSLRIMNANQYSGISPRFNCFSQQTSFRGYPLIYGIRAAKGLESKSVILLDFSTDLPGNINKPWRELLLGRAGDGFHIG